MDAADQALLDLREQMTEEQRQDMADLLKAELERREKEKLMGSMSSLTPPKPKSKVKSSPLSNSLGPDELGEVYGQVNGQVKSLRLKQLERQLADAKKQQKRMGKHVADRERKLGRIKNPFASKKTSMLHSMPPEVEQVVRESGIQIPPKKASSGSNKNALLLAGIAALIGLKVLTSSGLVNASNEPTLSEELDALAAETALAGESSATEQARSLAPLPAIAPEERKQVGWSFADKELLSQLDARRVELEHRRSAIERREAELEVRGKALAEKLAELRTISSKLEKKRKEKDNRYEARLEQLATVYGSMAPKEAAPLIGRLDEEIALSLLERMPGKRMGQILALMSPERAIELTKSLTDRRAL